MQYFAIDRSNSLQNLFATTLLADGLVSNGFRLLALDSLAWRNQSCGFALLNQFTYIPRLAYTYDADQVFTYCLSGSPTGQK